jgi:competence protein ComEC
LNLLHDIRQHPLVIITLGYIGGITLSLYLHLADTFSYSLILVTGIGVVLTIFFKSKLAQPILVIFFFLAGHLNGSLEQAIPDSAGHIRGKVDETQEIIVIGTVQRVFGFNGRTSKFDILSTAFRTADTQFEPVHGSIRYTMEGRLPLNIIPGKAFAIRAKLKTPKKYATPGSFDYPLYLAQQHIYVTSFIKSPLYIQQVQLQQPAYHTFTYAPEVLRTKINTFIDYNLKGEHAAVYKALLTGDRSSISHELIETFKGSGCLHILAISGIHMSLLGLVLYACFFWLLRRSTWLIHRINTKKMALCLCVIPLLFYTFIAGAKTPVIRSFIMSLVVIIAICYGKKHSFPTLVSIAALIVLALSPGDLATPSFQLTFAAVISIAAAFPLLTRIKTALSERLDNLHLVTALTWIIASLIISLAATLGTAPLLIFHFNLISLVGIFANLFVEPLLCLWSLTIGFAAILFIFIAPPFAQLLLNIGGTGIYLAIDIAVFFHSLPYSSLLLPTVSTLQIIFYYLCLLLLIRQSLGYNRLRVFASAGLLIIIIAAVLPLKEVVKEFKKESAISYLDVGHGSCTLIETPGGKRILVDGGALTSPGFDIGKMIITPFLLEKKILHVDDIIITHSDSDHYNGVAFLLGQFRVKRLWVNTKESNDRSWSHLIDIAEECGTEVLVPKSNHFIARNEAMSMQVIANTTDVTAVSADNDNGLIVKYQHGEFSALFPGDISTVMERKLVEAATDLKATILLAAHHGSATSNSIEFLSAVQPKMMVVSSGRRRSLFPAETVTTRCSNMNIPVITTNTSGTVSFTTRQGGYSMETFYPENSSGKWRIPSLTHR